MNDTTNVAALDAGFGSRKPKPEERIETLEKEVDELKRHHKLSCMG